MDRAEHVAWCKKRALEYIDKGDLIQAYASMTSDLTQHEETKTHAAIGLGMSLLVIGKLSTSTEMRKFIEGFH